MMLLERCAWDVQNVNQNLRAAARKRKGEAVNTKRLEATGACHEAVEWARKQPSRQAAWDKCDRGDWLLWILGYTCKPNSAQHKRLVLAACKCARLSLRHVPKGENRPLAAIRTAERWSAGMATIEEVRDAVADAYNAAADAYNAASSAAAARPANAAALAAAFAADATVNATANVTLAAAFAADTRVKTLRRCAIIVRKHFPKPPTI